MQSPVLLASVVTFALVVASSSVGQGPPDHAGNKTIPPVKINKVTIDNDTGEICIEGENFARRDFIAVELGGDPVALELVGTSDTKIVALIPGVVLPGTYRLDVITSVGPNSGAFDSMDVHFTD